MIKSNNTLIKKILKKKIKINQDFITLDLKKFI